MAGGWGSAGGAGGTARQVTRLCSPTLQRCHAMQPKARRKAAQAEQPKSGGRKTEESSPAGAAATEQQEAARADPPTSGDPSG